MTAAPYLPLAAAGLVFVAVMLCWGAVSGLLADRRRVADVRAKLDRTLGDAGAGTRAAANGGVVHVLAGLMGRLGERVRPRDTREMSRHRGELVRAGYRQPNAVVLFWGAKCFLAMVLGGLFLAARVVVFHKVPLAFSLAGAAGLALVGVYLPSLWLRSRIAGRKAAILAGLPDALDMLVVCVESGMGLDQALHRVGEELREDSKELSDELRMLNLELRAGRGRKDGLRDLADRIGLEDVASLVTLLIQSDSFGTSVAQTLRVYSDVMRTKRFQRAEEQAAKLPVKLLFPLIFFILPALFVVIAGPSVISLMNVFSHGLK
ncbi:MAG: type II secretion system F family protein [Desulfovibrionaceae bacterium]